MKKERKIGGEFEIDPKILNDFPSFIPKNNQFLFSSGRAALMAILRYIAKSKPAIIYIPYYICSSVVKACENSGFQIHFYELNNQFLFPIEFLDQIENRATLLSVNYFGFINDNILISEIKNHRSDITIISDQVQSVWTFKDTLADFSFTSLRKHIPTPDGALVYSKIEDWMSEMQLEENIFHWAKLTGALLKYNKVNDDVYLRFFELGEKELDQSFQITKASALSAYFYETTNWEQVKQRRIENYKFIYDYGRKYDLNFLFPYKENIIPFCVPILVENRDEVRKKLLGSNVFLPVHWPLEKYNKVSRKTKELTSKELSIIVDQRYSIADTFHQMNCIISNIYQDENLFKSTRN